MAPSYPNHNSCPRLAKGFLLEVGKCGSGLFFGLSSGLFSIASLQSGAYLRLPFASSQPGWECQTIMTFLMRVISAPVGMDISIIAQDVGKLSRFEGRGNRGEATAQGWRDEGDEGDRLVSR